MRRIQIIVVHPVVEDYEEDAYDEHLEILLSKCEDKNAGLIFVSTPPQDIQNSFLDLSFDEEEGDYHENNFMIDSLYDYVEYWSVLQHYKKTEKAQIIDLSRFIYEACHLDSRSHGSQNLFKKNFFTARAEYIRLFGDAESIMQEIHKKNLEVIITDFYTGFNLYKSFGKEFLLDCELVDIYDSEYKHRTSDEIIQRRRDHKFLRSINESSHPDIVGTWDVYFRDRGQFTLYFSSQIQKGKEVYGIISDRYGLAWFRGMIDIDTNKLSFQKYYFYDTLTRDLLDQCRLVPNPVIYELDLRNSTGQWWFDFDKEKINHCDYKFRKKLLLE